MRIILPLSCTTLALALALLACTPAEEAADNATAADVAAGTETTPTPTPTGSDQPDGPRPMMRHSGWRSESADGSVFATFLDDDGTYRERKNGEPNGTGTWNIRDDDALCFLPDGENVEGDCWELENQDSEGKMVAIDSAGRRIELQQIDYQPAEED